MPHLVCSLTFVQYTMEVIGNTLISRMLQILLFSWKNDQLINVVDCRGLMVEILIDPKKPIHPPSSCGKGGCNRDQCSASPYLLKDVWFQGWGLIGRY
jgi:hypothetical protein